MAMYSVVCAACLKISHLQRVNSYFLNKDSLPSFLAFEPGYFVRYLWITPKITTRIQQNCFALTVCTCGPQDQWKKVRFRPQNARVLLSVLPLPTPTSPPAQFSVTSPVTWVGLKIQHRCPSLYQPSQLLPPEHMGRHHFLPPGQLESHHLSSHFQEHRPYPAHPAVLSPPWPPAGCSRELGPGTGRSHRTEGTWVSEWLHGTETSPIWAAVRCKMGTKS